MFQSLRTNNQLYILHKDANPFIEYGPVVSVSAPKPKYPMASPMGQLPQMEMVVDVVVCINGQNTTFQNLPAGISPRLSGLIPMVRKRSILADMWGRRCSR